MTRIVRNRIDGIAEPLPNGEVVLWSGRPDTWRFTSRQFRLAWVAAWFAGLAGWRGWQAWAEDGQGPGAAVLHALGLAPLALAALGLLGLLGLAMARSTTYALTARRLVFNVGTALPVTFNVPLRYVHAVALRDRGTVGDLLVTLAPGERARLTALWPHVRSWRDRAVQPMLRDVPIAQLQALVPVLLECLRANEALPQAGGSTPVPAMAGAAALSGLSGARGEKVAAGLQATPTGVAA